MYFYGGWYNRLSVGSLVRPQAAIYRFYCLWSVRPNTTSLAVPRLKLLEETDSFRARSSTLLLVFSPSHGLLEISTVISLETFSISFYNSSHRIPGPRADHPFIQSLENLFVTNSLISIAISLLILSFCLLILLLLFLLLLKLVRSSSYLFTDFHWSVSPFPWFQKRQKAKAKVNVK